MTELLPLDGESLLAILEEAGVEFVVIGGFAVSAHGHPRATKDLDIVPDPDPQNLTRLAAALRRLGAQVQGSEEFSADEVVQPDAEGLSMGGNFVLKAAGRPEDLLDLKRLREARGE